MLLWCCDQAGTAQPQHHHDGQEEAGCQYPARKAWTSAEGQGKKNYDRKHRANKAIILRFSSNVLDKMWISWVLICKLTIFLLLLKTYFGQSDESIWGKLHLPGHAAQEVVLRCGILCVLRRMFPFPTGFGGTPITATPHTCTETWTSVW